MARIEGILGNTEGGNSAPSETLQSNGSSCVNVQRTYSSEKKVMWSDINNNIANLIRKRIINIEFSAKRRSGKKEERRRDEYNG